MKDLDLLFTCPGADLALLFMDEDGQRAVYLMHGTDEARQMLLREAGDHPATAKALYDLERSGMPRESPRAAERIATPCVPTLLALCQAAAAHRPARGRKPWSGASAAKKDDIVMLSVFRDPAGDADLLAAYRKADGTFHVRLLPSKEAAYRELLTDLQATGPHNKNAIREQLGTKRWPAVSPAGRAGVHLAGPLAEAICLAARERERTHLLLD